MKENFNKKIFSPVVFLRDAGFLFIRIPLILAALRNTQLSKAFIEKIMTVTTAVNGCTYCSWYHAKQALASGISEEEVKNMLNLQFQADASDFETMALLYTQHFAETNRKPEEEMTRKFFDFYDKKTAGHIYLFIRLINFGNLYGNTWDAVLSRFKGFPAEKSNQFFEFLFFILSFWFMFPIMALSKENL